METEELLRKLANAIIKYRVEGEKDFEPVNAVLLEADRILSPQPK